MNFEIKIPNDVDFIIETLKTNGFESYIVGGCVRDSLLNKIPKDWDITTVAKPEEIVSLFDKVILTGIKHGTVTVIINSSGYEVTTYRTDGEYEDNRHPKKVSFVSNIREDLARRDFTINAMAYNKTDGLIDYFQGVNDLNKKIITTVGNPEKRFSEDALRMLRAIRFSSELDFKISKDTLNSIINLGINIKSISKERIREEFNKILLSDASSIDILRKANLIQYICPLISKYYNLKFDNIYCDKDLYSITIKGINIVEKKIHLKLVMLFRNLIEVNNNDVDKTILQIKNFLSEYKYDNYTLNKVTTLIRFMSKFIVTKVDIKQTLNLIGKELFEDLLKVKEAEILSQNRILNKEKSDNLILIKENFKYIILNQECFNLKNLNINGSDLINLGVKNGKSIGIILNELLNLVMENPKLNRKETLINIIREKI